MTNSPGFSEDEQAQLKAFIEILDQAYLSENTAVKDALHQLMMITILCHGHKKSKRGPFKELFNKIKRIEDKLDNIKLDRGQKDYIDLQKIMDSYPGNSWDGYSTTKTFTNTDSTNWTTTSSPINALPNSVIDNLTMEQISAFFDTSKTTIKK